MGLHSLYSNLRSINPSYIACSWRFISSNSLSIDTTAGESSLSRKDQNDELKSRIFRLIFPRRSATTVLQNWVDEGRRVSVSELRRICKQLMNFRRYKHALEILTWMEDQARFQISAADHAIRLELITKVHTLKEAEEYFAIIPNSASQKAACLPLLHLYVKERATEKAEALMLKMNGLGLIVNPHPFNEMMKLYMATSQYEKVASVILQMKQNKIPRNVLSYNLWMSACGELSGVASAEMVYKEMLNDKNVEVGWSSLSSLANIYLKSGLCDKATLALRKAEKKLSNCNRLGYFFLITHYASLKNRDGVLRLWEACKAVEGRITCADYMCILSCFVKLGDIEEAERVFMEWESQCRKYDIRVSNVLLGAYMRNGLMEKAESLHLRTLEKGGRPNYKTWEILMEGWVKSQDMDKAISAMKNGFSLLKHCDWRPSPSTVVTIAEYFEKKGNIVDAKRYVEFIRRLGLASLPVYKSLLRMYACTQAPIQEILKMMQKDEINMDDETSALIQAFKV
ncbi:pentatricopeptide repeat-containing protein At5g27460 [Cornus florida]|uniref:pentatricopeptide repeat-containing protein At5g27460 n=1 Tax=Cornus florida TaxID=4283 RepID=UPI002899B06D|nr:pentatricopeptide repeat-containing protein At5g27460 [Cornus florida]XP_059631281.1 pentatricopeptide repeat-containing protein At5g27460 [Cornus florida]